MKKVLILLCAAFIVGGAIAAEHIVGGTGYTGNTLPWWGSYTAMRFQCCWFKSEINESGAVTKIEYQFHSYSGTPPSTFNNVKMYLCHTNLSALTSTFATNYGGNTPVLVWSGTYVIPSGLSQNDWVIQVQPTNFTYNNVDNLLMEVTWEGFGGGAAADYFWRSNASQPGRVYATSATATTGTLYAGQGEVARVTINYTAVQPSSLGRIKTLFK